MHIAVNRLATQKIILFGRRDFRCLVILGKWDIAGACCPYRAINPLLHKLIMFLTRHLLFHCHEQGEIKVGIKVVFGLTELCVENSLDKSITSSRTHIHTLPYLHRKILAFRSRSDVLAHSSRVVSIDTSRYFYCIGSPLAISNQPSLISRRIHYNSGDTQ